MSQTAHIGIVSSSLDPESRSAVIARLCLDKLTQRGVRTNLIDLRSINLVRFDNDVVYQTAEYAELHSAVASADGLILCTPVYNWSVSAELKKLIEATSTCITGTGQKRA